MCWFLRFQMIWSSSFEKIISGKILYKIPILLQNGELFQIFSIFSRFCFCNFYIFFAIDRWNADGRCSSVWRHSWIAQLHLSATLRSSWNKGSIYTTQKCFFPKIFPQKFSLIFFFNFSLIFSTIFHSIS